MKFKAGDVVKYRYGPGMEATILYAVRSPFSRFSYIVKRSDGCEAWYREENIVLVERDETKQEVIII